eukprot:g11751.t1
MVTRYGTVTLEGQELRVGTSRFLSQGTFLLYKSIMAAFFLFWGIWWAVNDKEPAFGAKLTFWTWYTTTAYFCLSSASAYLCWRVIGNTNLTLSGNAMAGAATATSNSSRMPLPSLLERLQLVVWNVACVVSLVVVTLYWFADYDGSAVGSLDILAHSLIALIMLIDQFLVADEFKLRHVIFSMVYGVFYVVFNLIWYHVGWRERLLYEVMDWGNKPLTACIYGAVCILVLCPLFALVHLFVYRHRERLHNRLQEKLVAAGRNDHAPAGTQSQGKHQLVNTSAYRWRRETQVSAEPRTTNRLACYNRRLYSSLLSYEWTRCGAATTVGGQEVRAGTSRFISQGPFLVYKSMMAAFFLFWAVWWREATSTVYVAFLTHQTWYIVMVYFFVSTASAYLYWRAINERGARGAEGALEDGRGGCDLTSQNNNNNNNHNHNNNVDSTPAMATTDGPRSPVPLPLRRLQLVVWSIACVVSLVVVALFWFAEYKGGVLGSIDILAHILIDQFLVADEFKLRHVIFSMVHGAFYVVFTIIWYHVGYRQRLLYEVMDWGNKPLTACIYGAASVFVLCPLFALVHLFV